MINYKEIIDNLEVDKVEDLLYQLGAENVIRKDNCLITNTICHNESDGSMKLYYYFDTHIFYCYSNCDAMSIFSFLKHYYETRGIEYDWFNDILQVVLNCSVISNFDVEKPRSERIDFKERFKKRGKPTLPIFDKKILGVYTKLYPIEWLQDGISRAAMDKFNILFSISERKIVIPHYNSNGELVGIRGRALNPYEVENVGKYTPMRIENTWYSHKLSHNLYGLNFNKENIKKNGYVYLVESEKAVMQMESFDLDNCAVAVCGSQFNKLQLNILLKETHPKEIIICFDKEELPNEEKYFNKLYKMCEKYKNYCNFSFLYDRNNLLELKDSPTDKGEEVFRRLLKEKVVVK